jgi:hypothetical protein
MLIEPEEDKDMRSAIFASVVLASGVVSLGALACDRPDVYQQRISGLLQDYQSKIIQANDAFAYANVPVVRVVYTDRRHSPVEYLGKYPYPNTYTEAVNRWKGAVDAAAKDYSQQAYAAYDNACRLWW